MDYEKEYQNALERAKKGLPLDEVFPELKESEDERIRKELIAAIDKGRVFDIDKDVADRWIAYLEKHKEQKPESCDCSRDEESYTNGIHHVLMNPEAYGLIKQKPAGWSEEDEGMLNCIIATLCEESHGGRETNNKMVTWLENRLKSSRPQPHWKPSEEQMAALKNAQYVMSQSGDYYDTTAIINSLITDLQKLL